MQTESAFLDDLIRHTWEGQLAWKRIETGKRRFGFCATEAGITVRVFTTSRNYRVSPGGIISETDYYVEKQISLMFFDELEAPRAWKKELWTAISFKAWEIDSSQRETQNRQGYWIRFDGEDPRGQMVLYEEPKHRLMVWVEIPISGNARWLASERSVRKWADPVDVEIDADKQTEIKTRIMAWSKSLNAAVEFNG